MTASNEKKEDKIMPIRKNMARNRIVDSLGRNRFNIFCTMQLLSHTSNVISKKTAITSYQLAVM